MSDWGAEDRADRALGRDGGSGEGSGWTIRQIVIRAGALLLLFSILGGAVRGLRGIDHIELVAAIVGLASLIGLIAKRQRASENPYSSDDSPEIH